MHRDKAILEFLATTGVGRRGEGGNGAGEAQSE
jgi:hypothetical protein